MRELKFRVWDKEAGEYLEGEEAKDFVLKLDGTHYVEMTFGYYDKGKNWVIEQYTGLQDKNGKEIYEGDIVNIIGIGIAQVIDSPSGEWMLHYKPEPDEINSSFASVVPKNKPSGLWKTNTTSYIEVIGNIHKNPELLEAKE